MLRAASSSGPLEGAVESMAEHTAPNASDNTTPTIPLTVAWRLYLSHSLSTWNSRSFEFGSVLFLAAIYPNTLFYLSIYAMVRSASAILFATWIGWAIDHKARLLVVRASIGRSRHQVSFSPSSLAATYHIVVAGRLAIILSSIGFWVLWTRDSITAHADKAIFSVLILLSCVEKLASVANLVSVERDWVSLKQHCSKCIAETAMHRLLS